MPSLRETGPSVRPIPQAPHSPLRAYYPCEEQRREWVRSLFDRSAGDYERMERVMALGSGSWYRRRALQRAGLQAGMSVVDVGVGTGLVAREAAGIVGDHTLVLGVDPSPGMIANAKVPPGVRLAAGAAESIPAADGSADFISMGYALRHVSDLPSAFREFRRVLKPGGRLCLLEITSPRGVLPRVLLKTYMRGVVPVIARVVARDRSVAKLMRYYWDTIEACVPPASILAELAAAGFADVIRYVEHGVFSEYRASKPTWEPV
jgi:demethylmenaquinone methyltransferase / 2-methoxy-6-polyprenyl-1,4-benzoquinol methylase